MKQILDAILADAHTEPGFADIPMPETYQGVTVHKDEEQMFAGMPTRDKDPRKSLHLDDVPVPELGPGEALVAVMASAINYNTVWTALFEPVSTFGFLCRYGRSHELAKRHDLPYHVVGSDLAGVVLRCGPGVSAWKPGDEVVAHCLSVELENPAGPQRHDDGSGAADLGLRDQLRRPGPDRPGQVQPAAGQARAPDMGGGRRTRPGQRHRLPPARLTQRRRDEAGRHRPDLGGLRRPGLLCHPDGPQRRRDASVRGLQRREGRHLPQDGRRADHRPQAPRATSSGRTRRPRTPRSGSGSASGSANSPAARTSTSCSSTRAARRSAPRCT